MAWLVGVDEVGRGPLAGPVVACACHLPASLQAPWVTELADSKALSAKKREHLAALLTAHAAFAVAEVSVAEIDAMNIRAASLLAMRKAVEALAEKAQGPLSVVVDGNAVIPGLSYPQTAVVKADASVPSVSAASILAKVYRDALMRDLHQQHPQYGWDSNAGYGSAAHLAALVAHGPTAHHRLSFSPVKAAQENYCGAPRNAA
jgi:ribonuclease HII